MVTNVGVIGTGMIGTEHIESLANHVGGARVATVFDVDGDRAAQVAAVSAALADHDIAEDRLPPIVAVLTMTGLTQVLALEGALGVTTGHDPTLEFVERTIARLDRPPEPS